jgi:hypothetical protein
MGEAPDIDTAVAWRGRTARDHVSAELGGSPSFIWTAGAAAPRGRACAAACSAGRSVTDHVKKTVPVREEVVVVGRESPRRAAS